MGPEIVSIIPSLRFREQDFTTQKTGVGREKVRRLSQHPRHTHPACKHHGSALDDDGVNLPVVVSLLLMSDDEGGGGGGNFPVSGCALYVATQVDPSSPILPPHSC